VIVTAPPAEPVTRPEVAPTDALALLALQIPPLPLVSKIDVPIHTLLLLPVMSDGSGFTDTVTPPVVIQPALLVAVTLYALLPVASGVIEGDAQVVHDNPPAPERPVQANVEPGAIAVKLAALLRQTVALFDGEMFRTGRALTTIDLTAEQPDDSVYDMSAAPATRPDTTPPEFTLATVVLELVHVPPVTELVRAIVDPSHTAEGPPIAAGELLMVTAVVYTTAHPTPVPLFTVSE